VNGIKLQQVGSTMDIPSALIDMHDVKITATPTLPQCQATDATKAIDSNPYCHASAPCISDDSLIPLHYQFMKLAHGVVFNYP
jgi:hypothetical protein